MLTTLDPVNEMLAPSAEIPPPSPNSSDVPTVLLDTDEFVSVRNASNAAIPPPANDAKLPVTLVPVRLTNESKSAARPPPSSSEVLPTIFELLMKTVENANTSTPPPKSPFPPEIVSVLIVTVLVVSMESTGPPPAPRSFAPPTPVRVTWLAIVQLPRHVPCTSTVPPPVDRVSA